jgi:hypothetical protein
LAAEIMRRIPPQGVDVVAACRTRDDFVADTAAKDAPQ